MNPTESSTSQTCDIFVWCNVPAILEGLRPFTFQDHGKKINVSFINDYKSHAAMIHSSRAYILFSEYETEPVYDQLKEEQKDLMLHGFPTKINCWRKIKVVKDGCEDPLASRIQRCKEFIEWFAFFLRVRKNEGAGRLRINPVIG